MSIKKEVIIINNLLNGGDGDAVRVYENVKFEFYTDTWVYPWGGDDFQRKLSLRHEPLTINIKKEVTIINNLLNGGDGESRTHVRNGNKRTSTSVGLLFLSVLRHEPIPHIPIKHFRLYRVWL